MKQKNTFAPNLIWATATAEVQPEWHDRNSPMSRKLHVVLHVPKCAGTTLEEHFKKHLGPKGFWSPGKRTRKVPLEVFGRKFDARPPAPTDAISVVSGHFLGKSVEQMFPGRRIVRSVVLRDPVQLMISYYNFRMMRYLTEGLHTHTFDLHLRAMTVDPVAHFFLERWLEMPWPQIARLSVREKVEILDDTLGSLDRVVDISRTDELAAWHSRELGIPEAPERVNTGEQWRASTNWRPVKLEDLNPGEREALEARVMLDRYLWRRWALGEKISFDDSTAAPFLQSEMVRPAYEIRRRLMRNYGLPRHQ